MTGAIEEKHTGHAQRVWYPSLHGNHADGVSALTAVRSPARKGYDHDDSSPHAEP
jgi:hypothetical protein